MGEVLAQKTDQIWNYWGKTGEDEAYHPLILHQLDVAASGLALLEQIPRLRQRLCAMSGLDERIIRGWVGFFLAIHDLGKFSSAFQQLNQTLCPPTDTPYFYRIRHDTLGYIAWRNLMKSGIPLLDGLAEWKEGASEDDDPLDLIDTWVQCVTGHHGQPPTTAQPPISDYFSAKDQRAVRDWVAIAAKLFLPERPLPLGSSLSEANRRRFDFSWLLAGFCILADWLGSNREHFPFQAETIDPQVYFENVALPQARRAIAASGLLPVEAAKFIGISRLFDFIKAPTPLQAACLESPLTDGPQLHILEDVTGAGKTEAAFILLARLMANGQTDGAYIAMPTMATANAMYRRTAGVYRKLYRAQSISPSLVLAHGSRRLDRDFNSSLIHPQQLKGEGEYEREEFDAEARCNAWLADNNKKALLAHIGVGTIDQALIGVLQSRHQSLRLLGLAGKVLLVDEVHASDEYMHTLLCQLLRMHARAGGSAILLSATLPATMREELIKAWGGRAALDNSKPSHLPYPLLTSIEPGSEATYQPVATRRAVRRALQFHLVHEAGQVYKWITEQASQGSCVAWIRNTVNEAIEAWQVLSTKLGVDRVILFHARFALGDRLEIENSVLEAFGPKSTSETRNGKVVVATQVIEQSLDLDFDHMISDLAPIDLLIQRAGRLRRHRRNTNGSMLEDDAMADQRGEPCLHLLSPPPDLEADDQWIRRLLPGTGAVYRDHGQLWLTVHEISQRNKKLRIPEDLRDAIESVYGEDYVEHVPENLRSSSRNAEGKGYSDKSIARLNAIKPATGYRCQDGQWMDESLSPTRLGEPTVTIRLARWQDGQLQPWRMDAQHPWALSELRLYARHFIAPVIDDPALADAIAQTRDSWPRALRHLAILPLIELDGVWHAMVRNSSGKIACFHYCSTSGLSLASKENP